VSSGAETSWEQRLRIHPKSTDEATVKIEVADGSACSPIAKVKDFAAQSFPQLGAWACLQLAQSRNSKENATENY
jgi:hypothetical protein